MQVIDTDPALLQRTANGAARAAEQIRVHIEAEIAGDIPGLMETLTAEGPYAYTILPEVRPDGSVRLPVITTADEIRDAYSMVRGASALLSVQALTEVRGEWYTFQNSISRTENRATGKPGASQTLALFPSGRGNGIKGDLVWARVPRQRLGSPPRDLTPNAGPVVLQEEVFRLYDKYLDAVRLADADALVETLNDGVASAVRDYVHDTGTLVMLEGKDAHRAYHEALFNKYDVRAVQPLDRVTEDWFVFAELRWIVSPRTAPERTLGFNTAEFFIPAHDGRFIARIGHCTDPV